MSPYFAEHPVTIGLFAVTVGVWAVAETRQRLRSRAGATRRDQGSYAVLVLTIAAGWIATAVAATHLPHDRIGGAPAAFVVGLVAAWAGLALRWWAFHTLGRYFTFVVQTSADQPVITNGPYRWVRHPSYTGLELTLLGLAAMYGTWLGLAAMLVLPMVGLTYRIRIEERALRADLGPAYDTYAATHKRLVPGVW